MGHVRQGDVLLRRTNGIEGNLAGTGKRILAYGEKTGHSHVLDGDVSYYENGNGMLMAQVRDNTKLVHDEHKYINIPEGDYIVVRQREFDILESMVRTVND